MSDMNISSTAGSLGQRIDSDAVLESTTGALGALADDIQTQLQTADFDNPATMLDMQLKMQKFALAQSATTTVMNTMKEASKEVIRNF
jgi:ACT domain-containing protein